MNSNSHKRFSHWFATPLFISAGVAVAQTTMPAGQIAVHPNFRTVPAPYDDTSPQVLNEPPEDPSTIAQQTSCLIQIDSTPSDAAQTSPAFGGVYNGARYGGFSDAQLAAGLLTSTVVMDSAGETLKITPAVRQTQVHVHATAMGSQIFRLEVDFLKGDATFSTGDSQKMLTALCEATTAAFKQSAEAHRKARQIQTEAAAKTVDDIKAQLTAARAKMHADEAKTSGAMNGNMYGDMTNTIANLRNQRQNAQSQLDRDRARLASLESQTTNSLVTEWEALVKQDQTRLDELTTDHAKGNGTDDAVKEARDKLTDAQTHLAQVKQQTDLADGNRNYRVQEAATVKQSVAEQTSRVKDLDDNIAKLSDPDYLKAIDEERELQNTEQNLTMRLNQAQNQMGQLPVESAASDVVLTLLDGKLK